MTRTGILAPDPRSSYGTENRQLRRTARLPKRVDIVEVSPRDGLQNEARLLTVEQKLHMIEQLSSAGVRDIEAGSFVNPRQVPQMADSDLLFRQLTHSKGQRYSALVPNLQGFHRAADSGAKRVALFTAASETFCRKNTHCSIEESLQRFNPVLVQAKERAISVRGYISCVAGCPYEGEVPLQRVTELTQRLLAAGCDEVCLADTTGVGTPEQFSAMIAAVSRHSPVARLAVHCHDTFGRALDNIHAALSAGISVVDSSVAGLGGCPYAHGAKGNVASEDLVHMLHGCGVETGIDLQHLISCGNHISALLGRNNQSRVANAIGGSPVT